MLLLNSGMGVAVSDGDMSAVRVFGLWVARESMAHRPRGCNFT